MKRKLIEGTHFYYNEMGYMVLTAQYHLENGVCCGNGCLNCPYDHVNVPVARLAEVRAAVQASQKKNATQEKNN
ncbi:MAG: hypothetical protein FJX89_05765 [Bacteroidetes bacterium]|nr:hypothetical protein [Bacteroidota bacterium]